MKAKIAALFDSQSRQSEKLVAQLAAHQATKPEVQRQYDELDQQCIELAGKMRAALDVQSPTWISIESDLKKCRWRRDAVKNAYRRELERLQRELEELTGPPIQAFHLQALDRAAGLSSMYTFERDELFYVAEHDVRMVKVRHNQAALATAKDLIFQRIREVRALRYRTLPELQAKIAESQRQFDEFDFSTLEIVTVSEATADLMKPHAEPDHLDKAHLLLPDGSILLAGGEISMTDTAALAANYSELKKLARPSRK